MTRKTDEEPRCSNGIRCVAYPALGEPSKLSSGNPGTTCFACEERRVGSELKTARASKKAPKHEKEREPRRAKGNGPEKDLSSREHTQAEQHARGVVERRRKSVLTCERGLGSALASGDERLVRRWSRSLREAEERLAWAESDLARAEKRAQAEQAS